MKYLLPSLSFAGLLCFPNSTFAQSLPEEDLALVLPQAAPTPSILQAPLPSATLFPAFKDPIARVNGTPITRQEFEAFVTRVFALRGLNPGSLPPGQATDFYKQVLRQMINEQLISQAAMSQVVKPEEIDEEIEKLKKQNSSQAEPAAAFRLEVANRLRQQRYLESQTKAQLQASEADAKAFYQANPKDFQMPPSIRASHIMVAVSPEATIEERADQLRKAQALAAQMKRYPEKFDDFAKNHSDDPAAKERGGEMGLLNKQSFPYPEVYQEIAALPVGEISDPIRSPQGFHIVKVTEKLPARTIPFSEAKERLIIFLSNRKRTREFDKVVAELRLKAKITIYQSDLAF